MLHHTINTELNDAVFLMKCTKVLVPSEKHKLNYPVYIWF